jgi:outer membrane protein assembly factor BamE (lipoprotein component of BamABCDE complex)
MRKSGLLILNGALALALAIPHAYTYGSHQTISCEEAAKNARTIKVGMKKSEVLELLGSPSARSDNRWSYDFSACVRLPKAGEQVITGLDIFFTGRIVKDIKWGWIDATGPGSPAPPKRQKNKQ